MDSDNVNITIPDEEIVDVPVGEPVELPSGEIAEGSPADEVNNSTDSGSGLFELVDEDESVVAPYEIVVDLGEYFDSGLMIDSGIVDVGNLYDRPFMTTPINTFTVVEGLLLIIAFFLACSVVIKAFNS